MKEQAKELMRILNRIGKAMSHKEAFGPMPGGEFFTMMTIGEYCRREENSGFKGVKITRIAEIMETTVPAASKLLRNLEAKGYIDRIPDEKDRRVVYVTLSETGREVIRLAEESVLDRIQSLLDRLGTEDSDELIRLFRKLQAAAKEEEMSQWYGKQSPADESDPSAET